MQVLGIETSCDETAAAVVENGHRLLSNVVASSMDLHVVYGGVVPEIAAREHVRVITPVIQQALDESRCTWDDIDAIAVTYGAGLGGSLLIGVMTARTLAIALNKPFYGVNHVLAHVYANFLTSTPLSGYTLPAEPPTFPLLALIVSGKHSEPVLFRSYFDYILLGQTQDDAVGEAFDKVARMLGLPYPGGPSVSHAALTGNAYAFDLPKAHVGRYDFSFSGLKTAVLRTAQKAVGGDFTLPSTELPGKLSDQQKADLAASFQRVAIETLVDKTVCAYEEFCPASVLIAGGVAANVELRRQLAARLPCPVRYPDIMLCTDNAAMVATLGCIMRQQGLPLADPFTLDIEPGLSL